jgi:protocatechuate 3,4-dioxygenase beta subunit
MRMHMRLANGSQVTSTRAGIHIHEGVSSPGATIAILSQMYFPQFTSLRLNELIKAT